MESIGLLGYALASTAYAVFVLLLFAARNDTLLARWVLICSISSVAVHAVASFQIELGYSLQWSLLINSLNIAFWSILVLLCNTEHSTFRGLFSHYYIRQYLIVWFALNASFWGITLAFDTSYKYIFLLFVVLNLWMLVLLEQLYRSAQNQIRWAIWPLVIALASTSLFDFVLFAQATMVDTISFDFWFSRGFVALFVVPLLLISTRRIKNGAVRVFVSRGVVFYSSMLMIAGVYLLVMALAGYVINYIGGEWGRAFSFGFLFLSGIVLAVLLVTETLRRRVKVFIAKHFFANKYEYRDEWLNLIEKIETSSADNHYQMATDIMMSKISASSGAIIKQESPTQFEVKYSTGFEFEEIFKPQLIHLYHFSKQNGWIIDLKEYQQTPSAYPELSLNIALFEDKNISVIVPIFIGKSFYGLFILGVKSSLAKLNWEDRDLLSAVAKQLGNFVSLHEANEQLAETKQFDAFNRMSAFLVHDLKNIQAQLALINKNAEKHGQNPEFIADAFETVESATQRLDKVLHQLRNKQVAHSQIKQFDIGALLEKIVQQSNVRSPQVSLNCQGRFAISIDGDTLQSVIGHLIQNAQEATDTSGWVKVCLNKSHGKICITIEDNGSGMSEEFIQKRLFKPFDTTKGNAGMGIGVYEAKQFFDSVAGELQVESIEGQGTKFTVCLPYSPNSNNVL